MQIIVRCPLCGTARLLHAAAADRRLECPNCRTLFKVPSLKDVPKALKVMNQAKAPVYVDEAGNTYG